MEKLENILIPTVPIINNGPELLVNAINRSASISEQIFCSFRLETIFAPTGYPLIIPIIRAKEPSPGTLKTGRIIFPKNFPKIETIFVYPNNSVAIKKGKREGKTEFAHKESPDFAATKLSLENKSKHNINKQTKLGRIRFFNFINTLLNIL